MRGALSPQSRRRAFSVFTLLVILAIILIVLALFLPALALVRKNADDAKASNNLKQMGVAVHNCASANNNGVPPAVGYFPNRRSSGDGPTKDRQSIFFHLLPYIEQQNVYNAVNTKAYIKTYHAPADSNHPGNNNWTSYVSNGYLFTTLDGGLTMPAMFYNKGTSNTIMFVERTASLNNTNTGWACNSAADYNAPANKLEGPMTAGATGYNYIGLGNAKTVGTLQNLGTDPGATAFTDRGFQCGMGDGTVRHLTVKQAGLPKEGAGARAKGEPSFYWGLNAQSSNPQPADW
jgi:hypothetical protein